MLRILRPSGHRSLVLSACSPTLRRRPATHESAPFALSDADRERLAARLQLAVKRARRSGRQTLAALTLPLPADLDPSAVACASRRPGESWFLLEQPERGARALAALGEAVCLTATGPERFATVADRWRALAAAAVSDPPEDPYRSGIHQRRADRAGRLRVRRRGRRRLGVERFRARLADRARGRVHARAAPRGPDGRGVADPALWCVCYHGRHARADDAVRARRPRRHRRGAARPLGAPSRRALCGAACSCLTPRPRGATGSRARCRPSTTRPPSRARSS